MIQLDGVAWTLLGLLTALTCGSVIRLYQLRGSTERPARLLRQRLGIWWLLFSGFAAAILAGTAGLTLLLWLGSCGAIIEFHKLFVRRAPARPVLLGISIALVSLHYACILLEFENMFLAFPVIALLFFIVGQTLLGSPRGYLRATSGYFWAVMLLGFGVSHAAKLSEFASPPAIEICLYGILLTELSDIGQALAGRAVGKHRITSLSPGKTWEGLAGGALICMGCAYALCPLLVSTESMSPVWKSPAFPLCIGVCIALGGFVGDINVSALKREAGVKDSSHALPGMGGVMDRIDSLTLSAPAFYYLPTIGDSLI